jgi:hypothetical protein
MSTSSAIVALLLMGTIGRAQEKFPTFKASPLLLLSVWEKADAAVVGDLRNIRPMGIQRIKRLPWPQTPRVFSVYWCEADFIVYSTVKGKPPAAGKKFVWGSGLSGCKVPMRNRQADAETVTRVWFIREEERYVRPVVDYPARFFTVIYTAWADAASAAPQIRFAQLILTPNANTGTLREFASDTFPDPAFLACWILGKEECISRMRGLAALGDSELRHRACEYLESQFRETCPD